MRLEFLHPALLGALALAALPVLIHLISRRKARDLRFAALEFILRSTRRRARRIQLRQLLLLALRTLLIGLVVLAVAGPRLVAPSVAVVDAPVALALCLDGSASMQARPAGQDRSLFELAVRRARRLLREQDASLPVALYLAGSSVQALVEPATLERGPLLQALEQVEVTDGTSDLAACVQRAAQARAEQAPDAALRVVVLTDGAAHAWPSQGGSAPGLRVEIARLPEAGAPQLDNLALRELRAQPSSLTSSGEVDVQLVVERSAGAAAAVATADVTLRVGERPLARVTAALPPGARADKSFMQVPLPDTPEPEALLRVELPADALAFDDQALLPLDIPRAVQVLVVDGDPQTVRHRDEVFYLERVLAGPQTASGRLRARFTHPEQLRAGEVAAADVVVLANVESLSDEVARALVTRVQAGGGLLIGAGDRLDPEAYNASLRELLPGVLRGAKDTAPLDDPSQHEMLTLQVLTPDHPIFTSMGADRTTGLSRVQTHGLLLFDPEPNASRTDLLRFSNGAPALSERRVGSGAVLLLCTTLDRDWSDLAIRPGYLPLMVQSLLYLANAIELPRQRQYLVGQAVSLRAPRDAVALVVQGPDAVPPVRLATDAGAARFEATARIGLYRVQADLGGGSLRPLPAESFVVEVDPQESSTDLVDDATLRSAMPEGAALSTYSAEQRTDRPLWTALLLLLALAVLGEAALSRRGA